ncbi:MAG TPA: cysteine desulfurase family protein [Bryobacteraceae bacterium]|nr:cysteine desulfurase family protein [Bryobacteraceae bacterium]
MPYFDHNATTFLAPEVAEVLSLALREVYGNASSTHAQGQLAKRQLEQSRRTIAGSLQAPPADFVFTSGGTESNNLAILGLLSRLAGGPKHVITSVIEHPSVLEVFRHLEREGIAVTFLPVDASGVVRAEAVADVLRPETVLVSVMHANNETGAVQPIREIAKVIRGRQIFLHSDGVQAFGKLAVDIRELDVDLYSVSAHKIFGPKGIGGLYVRKGTPLRPTMLGGHHERERRAGTENVPAAMAFARAVELCIEPDCALRDRFEAKLRAALPGIRIHSSGETRLPNTSNVLFPGVSAEALMIALDMHGMAVSTGAACSSGSVEPSHVLLGMGLSRKEARSSVRFSFGRYNTIQEIDSLVEATITSARKLTRMEAPIAV